MKLFSLRHWSLRAKLAALLMAASVLPLGISAVLDIRDMQRELVRDAQDLLAARADQVAHELDSIHQGYRKSAERVANLPAMHDYCSAPPDKRAGYASQLLGIFETFNKSDAAIHGVSLVDAGGRVVVASDRLHLGRDLSSRTTIQRALQGNAVITSAFLAPRDGQMLPTVAYLAPVRNAQNRTDCVVIIGVHAEVFWDVLRLTHEQAGANSYAVLYDEGGVRIGLSEDHSMLFRPAGPLGRADLDLQVAQARFGPGTRAILEDVQAFPEHFARARAATPDTRVFLGLAPFNQMKNYGVARRMNSVPWTVFYMVPEANILAQVAEATRKKGLWALGIIAVAGALGLLFAASILRPIQGLSTATAQVAAGVAGARVGGLGRDELGQLGASFNAMADKIELQASDLQRTNDELRQQADDLAVANKDLDAFASSVSHDLRAPLQVIDGFSQILATRFAAQLDGTAARYLGNIRTGVALMEQLVNGILKLSRLGRQPIDKQQVCLNEVISDVLVQLRHCEVLTRHRVQVTGDSPLVYGDRVLLQQVFHNLLANACKFSARQPQPEIEVGCEVRNGEHVCHVRDNGAGFDPAHAAQLFEPFRRLHSSEEFAGLGIGLGIGLSIVKRIVERHGGRIWAEAGVDKGACFYFTLGEPVLVDEGTAVA